MMTRKDILILTAKVAALTIVLFVIQAIGAQFLPGPQEGGAVAEASGVAEEAPQPAPGFMGLILAVGLLQTIALAYPVVRSRWHGWRLALTTFLLFFGTVTFMNQIELLVYLEDRLAPEMLSGLFLMGLFNAVVFAPIVVLVLGRWKVDPSHVEEPRARMSATTWTWKIALGSTVFLACYYLFGYYVAWKSPVVRDYYGGSDPGTFLGQMMKVAQDTPGMIPLQWFRGLLWVLLALLVIRMMRGRWWEAGIATALLFTVPAIYLLYPNPLMPEEVRMVHLLETAPYQFLFGWFVAWLFRPGGATAAAVTETGAQDASDHSPAVAIR
jgi:hypothetical protein